MRNLKKFLALVLAMMMTLSLMVTVNAAKPVDFSDKDKITAVYKEAVDVLSALKIVKGDNGFRPGEPITRAEVAAIVYRIVTGDVEDKNVHLYEGTGYFTDVVTGKWYDGYVNYCANNGLVQGVGGGKFEPSEKVTGYQALVMILRAIGYNDPKEFSGSDWKLKASGYGRRLQITKNIAEGSLGGYATREMIAEIMFRGIQTEIVKYTLLNDYVGTDTTLLLNIFDIQEKAKQPGRDNYGNPYVKWVSPSGATKIQIDIAPVDTFYTAVDECELVEKLNDGDDIDVDYEFLNGRSVERANTNAKGEIIGTRTLDALHTTDDFVGAQGRETKVYNYTLGGSEWWDIVYVDTYLGVVRAKTPVTLDTNGHVMHKATLSVEVGEYDNSDNDHPYAMLTSNSNFDAYNVGDVVLLKTWSPSAMSNTTASVAAKDAGGDKFTLYLDWTGLADADALTYDRLTTKASAQPALDDIAVGGLASVKVTVKDADNTDVDLAGNEVYTIAYTGSAYPKGTYTVTVAADPADGATITFDDGAAVGADAIPFASHDFDTDKFTVVSKATDKTVTITGTTGAAEDKTGIYTADGTIMANVVYHVHNHGAEGNGHVVAANRTTPTSVADLYKRITNEEIGRTYKLWLDAKGNILGMEPTTTARVGVVLDVEGVRVSTGNYALEATLLMEDESTITARFLKDGTVNHQFWNATEYEAGKVTSDYADASEVKGTTFKFGKNALVEIEPYTKNGQTYYQVVNGDTDYAAANNAGTVVDNDASSAKNIVNTGVSNTFTGTAVNRVNGDTVFFIAYKDFQYNWGTGNEGGNDNITWKVVRDFRDIPTIDGDNDDQIVQQILGDNNGDVVIAKYAAITSKDFDQQYDMTGKAPVEVDDSYLIIAPIGTYARYSEYSVMHNGVKETLKVANDNNAADNGVNAKVEAAMASGQLIKVEGWNLENAATKISFVAKSNAVKTATKAEFVSYDDAGVLTIPVGAHYSAGWNDGGNAPATDTAVATNPDYLTLAKTVKVMIVNRDRNTVYDGTTANIEQYAKADGGHAFAWEKDANGYISTLYILD